MPGPAGAAWKINEATFPLLFTPSTAGPAPVSYGIWIFIWPEETNHNGADTPFTVAEVPASVRGSG